MKRKFSAFSALVLVGLVCCVGCTGGAGNGENSVRPAPAFTVPQYDWDGIKGVTINLWTRDNEMSRSYMEKALERYQVLTGNQLHITEFPPEVIEEKTVAALAARAEDGPDVLLSYGGANITPLHPDENLYDLSNEIWVDDLTTASINQTIYNGRVIGLPHWEASISGVLYNKRVFQKLGLTVPTTQAEFQQLCRTLLEKGVTPMYMPIKNNTMLLYQFPMDSLLQEGDTLEKLNNGELTYSQIPEMKTIVGWYKGMAEQGYLGPDWQNGDWDGMNQAMRSEQYAMLLCWDTWLYTNFDGDPSDYGLMPAFMGLPEGGTFEGPNLALLMVNRHSQRLDAARNFITFMADPYNYNEAFAGIYTAPVFKNQIQSIATPQYVEVERLVEKQFRDSTAWLRIQAFAQEDAAYIVRHMSEAEYTAADCLRDMDAARQGRLH